MAPSKASKLLCCCSFLLLHFFYTNAAQNSTFVPTDVILINCGTSGKSADDGKREWQGDTQSKFLVGNSDRFSVAAAPSMLSSPVPSVPFSTARVFKGPAAYSIPVAYERTFVRLYFYPSAYGGRNISAAVFDVEAGSCTLLRSFSPAWEVEALNTDYIVREYSLKVSASGYVNLAFTPSTSYPDSYAFVNGIEVISMLDIFTLQKPLTVVGLGTTLDSLIAVETMYRLNVGGAFVNPMADSGLFRQWVDDALYCAGDWGLTLAIQPNFTLRYPPATSRYIAPEQVYTTQRSMARTAATNRESNLTWLFKVDPGFKYLLRLHFCDIQSLYNKPNACVFSIYINNLIAEDQADVNKWARELVSEEQQQQQDSGFGVPFYRDYIKYFPEGAEQVDLRLDLHPNDFTKPEFADAVLNGLEVFKSSNEYKANNVTSSVLAGPRSSKTNNSRQANIFFFVNNTMANKAPEKLVRGKSPVGAVAGGLFSGFFVACGVTLLILWRRKKQRAKAEAGTRLKIIPRSAAVVDWTLHSNVCRKFTLAEIEDATRGFDENLAIGAGGFGRVYKGVIRTEAAEIRVAIKRANRSSEQGVQEFLNEIETMSKLRHRHLVTLIGFCDDRGEMILVYDYMANGTLREHLQGNSGKPLLGWQQRLEICIGAARGLHYLHTGVHHTIIHRDVKSTNILLDESLVAKVADFGLSRAGPDLERRNIHVSTVVKGSFGYLDPEYYRLQRLTDKSDVYSFGVVLFEVLCGRPAVKADLPHEQASLAEWARLCYTDGVIESIVDPHLKGQITPDCFDQFVDTAIKCISDRGLDRPSMEDVLSSLDYALQLQVGSEKELNASIAIASCPNGINLTSTDSARLLSAVDVFSSIIEPKGR